MTRDQFFTSRFVYAFFLIILPMHCLTDLHTRVFSSAQGTDHGFVIMLLRLAILSYFCSNEIEFILDIGFENFDVALCLFFFLGAKIA